MLLYANTSVFVWKSTVFWFCEVWCLHTHCEMRHFYTLRCPAPFWLIQCTPYQNRFIIAKVIAKSLGARFYGPLCIIVNHRAWMKYIKILCIFVTWGAYASYAPCVATPLITLLHFKDIADFVPKSTFPYPLPTRFHCNLRMIIFKSKNDHGTPTSQANRWFDLP